MPGLKKKLMAHPRGIITHWLAGNILNLGIISLVQGILTKNVNVMKIPANHGLILPVFMNLMSGIKVKIRQGKYLHGKDILNTVLFVYCEKEDTESQIQLSLNSDVRIIWGGEDAVKNVLALPKKTGTEDIIFGPKYSFALIGKNSFDEKRLEELAYKLALDVSMFEQRACTSPHTIFIEKGSKISPIDWTKALVKGFEKVQKRMPKPRISADEAYSIVEIRSRTLLSGLVFSSEGTEWTVIYSDEPGLAEPHYSRVISVRPIEDIENILEYLDHSTQTLGLILDEKRKQEFARKAAARGIERITDIGQMHIYDYPWDGIFPLNRLVRWVSME